MLKLAKRENNLFFKLMVMCVITSFVVTSVPEYSWAHLSGVVITDFISCRKIVGDLYRLPGQSKLISLAFFMEQINNENLRKEIKQAINCVYIRRNISGESKGLFDTRIYLEVIDEKIYETAEESSKIIAGFCQSHLNGIKNFFNLKFKNNTLLRYIKLVFFSSNLSVNIWEENIVMLKKLGLPVNAVTILFMGRIFLWSSRNVLQTRKKIATRKKNRIKYKTKIKKWKNKFCLSKFAGMNRSNSNSESRHTVNLPQGVRGSPAGNFYRNRRKRTSLRKEIINLDTGDEEEANNSLFVHSFKIFLQTEQTLENPKVHLFLKITTKYINRILNNFIKPNQIINNKFQKKITVKFKYFLYQIGSIFNIKNKLLCYNSDF